MKGCLAILVPLALIALASKGAGAQAPAGTAQSRVIGEVTAVDPRAGQITLKPDSGGTATIGLTEKTLYLRVPPGEKDLRKASKIALSDIGVGDRVLARGTPALSIVVMTKSDLEQKHARDRAEWQKRGTAGTIVALKADTKEITISTRTREGAKTVIVDAGSNVTFRRYAPDSVRFADAKQSSFAELKLGDQVRVLGDKNEDGTRIRPEEIVSGSFRNVAGTITAVDAASGEIQITDLQTKRALTVRTNPDSMLRRIPPMLAARLGQTRQAGEDGRTQGRPGGAAWQGRTPGSDGPPSGGPRGRGMDFQQMLERMPALSLAELKKGDAIIVSSTAGTEPSHITAIVLVAGVEPMLAAAPQGERPIGGAWNLDIGLP